MAADYLTPAEVMAKLRIKSLSTLYDYVKDGKLRCARPSSRRRLFPLADVERFLAGVTSK